MTDSSAVSASSRENPFPADWRSRAAWIALAAYVVYAAAQMDLSVERVAVGLHNASHFLGRMFPPSFTRWELLLKGLEESLEIAVLASALGIALSLPIGLCASRNLMPAWASWPARLIIGAARSFHTVIVAILFVKGDHSRIPDRRPGAGGRPSHPHVADRHRVLPHGRSRGADRDAPHRIAVNAAGPRNGDLGPWTP